MNTFNYKGQIHTLDKGLWYCEGGFVVGHWWQDRLNKYHSIGSDMSLQEKTAQASELADSLARSLELQREFPNIFIAGSVSLTVQCKTAGDNFKGVNVIKQLPYRAWIVGTESGYKLNKVDSRWYLDFTKSNWSKAEESLIIKHWVI